MYRLAVKCLGPFSICLLAAREECSVIPGCWSRRLGARTPGLSAAVVTVWANPVLYMLSLKQLSYPLEMEFEALDKEVMS